MEMNRASMGALLELRNRVVVGTATPDERADFADLVSRLAHQPSVGLLRDLLEDEDEIVRYEALNALVLRMGQRDAEMERICRRLLREDPDGDVRRLALACLGSIYFDSSDVEFFEWIRESLRQKRFEPNLLATAYQVLFQIAGRPASEWPDRMGKRTFMSYEELDWNQVAKLESEVMEEAGKGR